MMNWDDVAALAVCTTIVGATLTVVLLTLARRHARAKQRLGMLERALEHPQLDASTRSQILSVLANEHEASKLRFLTRASFWQRLIFGGGWLVFVFFGGVSVLAMNDFVPRQMMQLAMTWSLFGFAVMTLPLALRELLRRNRQLAD